MLVCMEELLNRRSIACLSSMSIIFQVFSISTYENVPASACHLPASANASTFASRSITRTFTNYTTVPAASSAAAITASSTTSSATTSSINSENSIRDHLLFWSPRTPTRCRSATITTCTTYTSSPYHILSDVACTTTKNVWDVLWSEPANTAVYNGESNGRTRNVSTTFLSYFEEVRQDIRC